MTYSAIVLSGGASQRFKIDKGLFKIFNKPLIMYTIERIKPFVDEILIVTSQEKVQEYSHLFPTIQILSDEYDFRAAISGAATGFKYAKSEYSFLLPCDTPFLSPQVLSLFKDLSPSYDAVIPRWPNGYLEPLQAIYQTKEAYKASLISIEEGQLNLRYTISKLKNVLFISTIVIRKLDSNLRTFYNINSRKDLQQMKKFFKNSK